MQFVGAGLLLTMTTHEIESVFFVQTTKLPQLRQISVFEDFNERCIQHLRALKGPYMMMDDRERLPARYGENAQLARAMALIGPELEFLEHLSVAFMIDASIFLLHCHRGRIWHRLQFLSLTSRMLHREAYVDMVSTLLTRAALAAKCMPNLERLLLWNAVEGESCSFEYRRSEKAIIWTATWDVKFSEEVIRAWNEVVDLHFFSTTGIRIVKNILRYKDPLSHAEGMTMLNLPPGIVDPISLFQMQDEALWELRFKL